MKKYLSLIIAICFSTIILSFTTACTTKEKLYVVNVGDYIDDTLISKFEKEYNCQVVYKEFGSNEAIYQSMLNDSYDVCVVSDYMIDKLRQNDMVKDLDYSKVSNYSFSSLFEDAQNLMNVQCSTYKDYFVPYFWGTVGILYNTDVIGLEDFVLQNGLKAIFGNNKYKKGMYNSAREALCVGLLANGGTDINSFNVEELEAVCQMLKNANYNSWDEDKLKSYVHDGELDMALVYSGDYLDEVYTCELDEEPVNFKYYAPDVTNIWIDGMCITSKSKNEELAYEFINFFSDFENQKQNALFIGYAPLVESVFNAVVSDYEYTEEQIKGYYPYSVNRQMYRYVSDAHYTKLNDLFEEAKSSK